MTANSRFPVVPDGRLTVCDVLAVETAVSVGVPTTAGDAIYPGLRACATGGAW
jgi:hypothetical protein